MGYNIKGTVLLDYAANYCYQGWNYKIIDSPILIFDQRIDLNITSPCTSKGSNKTEVLLNYENNSLTFNSDIYFLMQDATGNIYSYPNWNLGIRPFLTKFSIPEGAKIENAKILDIAYPSDKPKIHDEGYYNFFFATIASDAPTLIGKYGNHLYLVGNEPPTPDLSITGEKENFPCDNRQVKFDTSNSWDLCDNIDELLVRFDFEGDGVWDTDFQTDKIEYHIFPEPGIYHPVIELKDTGGLVSTYNPNIEIGAREGLWIADQEDFIKETDPTWDEYLNFTVVANEVVCSYCLSWEAYEPYTPHYRVYWTIGSFKTNIVNEKFEYKLEWGLADGIFFDCSNGSIGFENSDPATREFNSSRAISIKRMNQ